MRLKETVNRALHTVTGYQLARDPNAARAELQQEFDQRLQRRLDTVRQRHRQQRKALRAEVRQLRKQVEKKSGRQQERLPSYVDDSIKDIIRRSQPRTLTGVSKLLPLVDAVRYVAEHEIPGAVVECGVWRGGSMQAAAWTLMAASDTGRDIHLYDTFEGMSEPTEDDVQTRTRASAADLLAAGQAMCRAGLDDVREGMRETGYPMERVHFHEGKVEDTIPEGAPEQIAVLRLDTDWYESTKHELEHLYDRLAPGGVLIIDDFGSWDGARKATLEWLEESGEPLLLVAIGAARLAVKPGR